PQHTCLIPFTTLFRSLELEEIVSLGYKWLSWVNKWFVIPVFNYFLTLNWGMGLIILILTIMVKIIISPLTYKSYISSAKMRVLRSEEHTSELQSRENL